MFLNNVIINKTKVLLPRALVTLTDCGYPVKTLWLYCSQNFKNKQHVCNLSFNIHSTSSGMMNVQTFVCSNEYILYRLNYEELLKYFMASRNI
jgi:hypothetical protein